MIEKSTRFATSAHIAWPSKRARSPAKLLAFTGRRIDAEAALRLGIVQEVVPRAELEGHVRALAEEIAANAPLAVQATKRMMRLGMEEDFETNVHHVFLQLLPLFRSEDFKEGVASFMERRPGKFQGR